MAGREECVRHAAACVRIAQRVKNPRNKAVLLQMADVWRRLAQKASDLQQSGLQQSGHAETMDGLQGQARWRRQLSD